MDRIRDYQGRIFAGLLIILIGVLFLLGNLGKLDIGEVFSTYWPLILVFIGLWHLIAHEFRSAGFGVILLLIGGFFMLVIFKPRFKLFQEKAPEIKEKDLDAFIIFSGINRRFTTPEFRGGKATALFGGIDLDFTQAGLADNKATIELTAIFGGIEVLVPNDWEVVVDSSSIFGGVEDKHKAVPPAETKATLFVRATAMFGGIEVK
jgi:predicted membrane protein